MSQEFYYLDSSNNQKGPFDIYQIKSVGLKSDTLVWTEGLSGWKQAKEVDELKSLFSKLKTFPPPPPITKTAPPLPGFIGTTIIAKNFRCDGCGASLPIPKNPRGLVRCPHCKNDCVLDSIIKNAEIAAKEHINSGIPLTASSALLHRLLVSLLSKSPCVPLDVFDKVEVVGEERFCVPSYSFYCNTTASFSYEVGIEKKQKYSVDTGNEVEVRTEYHTEWNPGYANVSESLTIFASGNRSLSSQIMEAYNQFDTRKLVDVEELVFPADVDTCNFDLPQTAAFQQYVAPNVENLLTKKAIESISNLNYRSFSMGGSNIHKEVVRVFLGLYRIDFMYEGTKHTMWATGDGTNGYFESLPIDYVRKGLYDNEQQALNLINKKGQSSSFISRIWSLVRSFSFQWHFMATLFTAGIYLAVLVIIYSLHSSEKDKNKSKRAKIQKNIDGLQCQITDAAQNFRSKKKALRGIYKGVSGDSSAF